MLLELTVRNLGVIDELGVVFGPGMTVLTGETGAGKTLVVEAIELLVGGRSDAALVRPGAAEAWVEGRFVDADGAEVVLARAVPASGRSRGYVDGKMAPASRLAEVGAALVDLHGQHAHQSLLAPAVQRRSLDAFGAVDRSAWNGARERLRAIDAERAALGGDPRERARHADLLRFQVEELRRAQLSDPEEDARLARDEAVLADATSWLEAAAGALEAVNGDGGASDTVGGAAAVLRRRGEDGTPFADIAARLDAVRAELVDAATDLRAEAERITADPERLAEVQARRHVLQELRRKYGDTLADVIAFAGDADARLAELDSVDDRAAALEAERAATVRAAEEAAGMVMAARQAAAPGLADAIEGHLAELAMAGARFRVDVGGGPPGDEVVFSLGANQGEPVMPLSKVASGGELARTMLAARLVLTAGPPTLVFDEVDAGIGGQAAIAVGRALAGVAAQEAGHQVLVVTHLPQVAAFADTHISVAKHELDGRTVARAQPVEGAERLRELSRMLSGQPDCAGGRDHASELLELAAGVKRAR